VETIAIKYSKYANSLDKLFKNYSLASFKKNLNNPKKFVNKEFDMDKMPKNLDKL